MKAELQPYDSKYYGTVVRIYFNEEDYEDITIWNSTSMVPSIRQIKYRDENLTQEDYDNNIEIESYFIHGEMNSIQNELEPIDNHFEIKEDYERALELIDKINKK